MDNARMSSFLEYPILSGGDSGTCSARAYPSDHGITTFQSCAVSANSCGGDDRFLVGRGVQISPPHHHHHHHHHHPQPATYQTPGNLGVSYSHSSCGPSYGAQNFGAPYSPYPLNQEAEPPRSLSLPCIRDVFSSADL
ncbi:homeobox protein Hox-A1 isoform X2 [Diceros bicornis minor]|uniref:Homeobox protein Hox-A1 isoform X2 n=1 Tax=Ceratotherium simum simum TaxID=73337 RepID=A0ABM0H3S2_CERSS|nr:PREDICTED: homeobox protein Hox-A1 isoform X2 [Ceratotherium simum simum]XP_058383493.1 homeobox protein Hox-A1 isoform X2 [Diceros bicornis minor]